MFINKDRRNFFLNDFKRSDNIFRTFRLLPNIIKKFVIDKYVLTAKHRAYKRYSPERMTLFLTNKCNMKCAHCFIIKEIQPTIKMMTLEEYTILFDSIKGDVSQILITGGEPVLRNDLGEIVVAASKVGKIKTVNIFSNGFMIKKLINHLKFILDNCDIKINYQTSLDGNEEFHDINRRVPKAFKKTLDSIKEVYKLDKKYPNRFSRVIMTTAISQSNLGDLSSICDITIESGANPAFVFVRTSEDVFNLNDESLRSGFVPEKNKKDGSIKFDNDDYLSVEQMENALKTIKNKIWNQDQGNLAYNYNRVTLEAIKNSKKNSLSPLTDECRMGFDDVIIFADGSVSRCENLNPVLKLNQYEYDLPKLLESNEWKEYMKKSSGCWCTHDCGLGVSMMKEPPLLKRLVENN